MSVNVQLLIWRKLFDITQIKRTKPVPDGRSILSIFQALNVSRAEVLETVVVELGVVDALAEPDKVLRLRERDPLPFVVNAENREDCSNRLAVVIGSNFLREDRANANH
jgi:hypothetical protein